MILRPHQIALMRQGLPATPANFKGGSTSQSNPTTTNQYADKRNAVQNGIGVSGDGNLTSYTSNSYSVTTDNGAINDAMALAGGAIGWSSNVATNIADAGLGSMRDVAISTGNVSSHLSDVGLSMLQANTALANSLGTKAFDTSSQQLGLNTSLAASLTNGTNNLVTSLFQTVGGLYRDAASQDTNATQIAADLAKSQVAAQNDNRYLIAAGLAVVCIVGVMAFKKG